MLWSEALFRRLATLHLSEFFPCKLRNLRHSPFLMASKISVERNQIYSYYKSTKKRTPPTFFDYFCKVWWHTISWYLLNLQFNTPHSVPSYRTDVPKNICIQKFKIRPYQTIVDIRGAMWFIYIRMPLYPSMPGSSYGSGFKSDLKRDPQKLNPQPWLQ